MTALGAALEALGARLASRRRRVFLLSRFRRAAVLVPLIGRPDDPDLLLFERSDRVLEHQGEICFPGGSVEPGDDGPIDAALREAHEELGIKQQDVRIIGLLDDVKTHVSNYVITPVVGHVAEEPALVPDALEVSRVIRVGLRRLLRSGVQTAGPSHFAGVKKLRYAYSFDGNVVWGATARILHSLLEVLK